MKSRLRVCLIVEGSYPYVTGGVGAWVHQLIQNLPGFDFLVFSISPKANQSLHYKFPENVLGHKDVVIMETRKSGRLFRRKKLFDEIRIMHERFESGDLPSIDTVAHMLPGGYFLHDDAVRNQTGWEMLTSGNQSRNPAYPFSDYFWAWNSSHLMIFNILGTEMPDADVYHAISTGYAGLAASMARIKKNRPFLLTEHGLYHKEREMEIKRTRYVKGYQRDMWIGIYNTLSRISYRYADKIISLFEANRRKQVELGAPQGKTMVIPNGIDIESFSSIRKQKKPGFHIGLIGRVVPIKDIKTYIIASKIILDLIPEVNFYCIGPTDEDEAYFEECKILVDNLRLAEKFVFTGKQRVADYYSFLDILMLTSIREAQPLVILEAFCSGVLVVSTNVGNVPELLNYDERFLSPPKDPDQLARKVKYIYDNYDGLSARIAQNRNKVIKFYNRHNVFGRYGELYAGNSPEYKIRGNGQ
ncbi:MAG: GT4 family glycosyltransferase PelF [Spirochaetales bacterium]|nr:GT4 family glycosyltransferase PelF [Spirochaetales bacterium]